MYAAAGDGAHSLKPLAEPIHIALHALPEPKAHAAAGGSSATADDGALDAPGALSLSIDPLVRMGQLQQHLLRTSSVSDTAYEAFCTRLLGCVVEERPLSSEHSGTGTGGGAWRPELLPPFRRATVTSLRVATPLKLLLHTLVHDDGRECEVVLATRQYRIIGKVSKEVLELKRNANRDADATGGDVADPEARIHTVSIACPEGLPVDLFLENVLSLVRRALRQAEPGAAPMSRAPSDEYGWRDRGWERGGAQFERSVAEKLRDTGVAAVARRQTKAEAETLVGRLSGMMMVSIEIDKPAATTADGDEPIDRYPALTRVQGLVAAEPHMVAAAAADPRAERASNASNPDSNADPGGAQWLSATVVEGSVGGGVSLIFDDGTYEAAVPAYRVRAVPLPESRQRLNPLAAIFMSFEQFLSSREERRAELEHGSRDAQPANLRRSFSAFHVGRAQQVGRVPRAALEDDADDADAADAEDDADAPALAPSGDDEMDTSPMGTALSSAAAASTAVIPFDIAPMRLVVRFALGTATDAPEESCGMTFEEDTTLLRCLQVRHLPTISPQSPHNHPTITPQSRRSLPAHGSLICFSHRLSRPRPPPLLADPQGGDAQRACPRARAAGARLPPGGDMRPDGPKPDRRQPLQAHRRELRRVRGGVSQDARRRARAVHMHPATCLPQAQGLWAVHVAPPLLDRGRSAR